MNRALLPLLLALPLGCRGTFDLEKYIANDESGTMTNATTLDDTASTDASSTTLDESDTTDDTTETTDTDTTDTDPETETTDTDTDSDTDVACMVGLIDIGSACIGLKQLVLIGGNAPTDIEVGDFSGDGLLDLLVSGTPVTYVGGVDGGMFMVQLPVIGASGPGLAAVDVDLDGVLDFAAISQDEFTLLRSNGAGSFTLGSTYAPGGHDGVFADLDDDGDDDVILTGPSIYAFQHDGNLVLHANVPTSSQGLALADLDEDNDLDIVLTNDLGQVEVILTDGAWGWSAPLTTPLPLAADVAVANLDVLSDLEVIAVGSEQEQGQVAVIKVEGNALVTHATYAVGSTARAVGVGDIDGDTILDVAVGNAGSHDLSLLLGTGDLLNEEIRLPADDADGSPESIEMADLDNDGRAEIIVGMIGSNQVLVYGHVQ